LGGLSGHGHFWLSWMRCTALLNLLKHLNKIADVVGVDDERHPARIKHRYEVLQLERCNPGPTVGLGFDGDEPPHIARGEVGARIETVTSHDIQVTEATMLPKYAPNLGLDATFWRHGQFAG
jgi:hypothetical protein